MSHNPSNPLSLLPVKKQRYLKNRIAGLNKKESALAAGYSESSAKQACQVVETVDVRKAFAEVMRKEISPKKIAKVVNEGLSAVETKFFASNGLVTDSRDVINYGERRQYADLASRLADYYSPKQEIDVKQSISEDTARRLADLSEKLLQGIDQSIRENLSASHVPVTLDAHSITNGDK
jgi:hypothetical protein